MVHHIYAVNSVGVSEIREEISGWHLKPRHYVVEGIFPVSSALRRKLIL